MTQKEISTEFLTKCASGNPKEAFKLYVGENFKHHNPYFKGDAESLESAMQQSSRESPNKLFEIMLAIQENNIVSVHSHIVQENNDIEFSVVHILRFKNKKIVEVWDIIQNVPEELINENGMF